MITVESLGTHLGISFNYYHDYIRRIRQIEGSVFDSDFKRWIIGIDKLDKLEELFQGELYYKTPRWKILGEPIPKIEYNLKKHYEIPKLNKGMKPFKYQEFGFQFIMNKLDETGFCFLADGVGLGKTLSSIMCFQTLFNEDRASKLLILAKKSIKKQWIDEINKFTNLKDLVELLEYIPETATKKKRDKMYETHKNANKSILVTTYQSCMFDLEQIKAVGFDCIIIDEAHVLRTVNGKMNTSVAKSIAKVKYKIELSGTPLMSKPNDMYALTSLCDKKYFGPYKAFKTKHIIYDYSGRFEREVGYKHLDELRDKCQKILLRRTEHEVRIDLPKVLEQNISVTTDKVQEKLISILDNQFAENTCKLDTLKESLKQDPKNKDIKERYQSIDRINKGLIACRQAIANDPRLLDMSKSPIIQKLFKGIVPKNYRGSNKTEATLNIIENILESGEKVIVFSKFERSCTLLKNDIEKNLKIQALTFTGVNSEKDRIEAVELFTKNPNYNVLLGTEAMSEGLNLSESNHIIHYDMPDTVAIKVQRVGRARRASSTFKCVMSYVMITEGTVDEANLKKLEDQSSLFSSLVELSEEESLAMRNASNG